MIILRCSVKNCWRSSTFIQHANLPLISSSVFSIEWRRCLAVGWWGWYRSNLGILLHLVLVTYTLPPERFLGPPVLSLSGAPWGQSVSFLPLPCNSRSVCQSFIASSLLSIFQYFVHISSFSLPFLLALSMRILLPLTKSKQRTMRFWERMETKKDV